MGRRIILDQPDKGDWTHELSGVSTSSYEPRKAAEQVYQFIREYLPYRTVEEFQKLVNNRPFVPFDRPAIVGGNFVK